MSIKNYSDKIFFILGCQRSGTTLLRLVLESHSKISCIDESRAYTILSEVDLLDKELEINNTKKWIGIKTPRITEQFQEPYLADAGADFIGMTNYYENTHKIFMVRNPLDTIVSMKKLDQSGKSWLEIWAESTIDFWRKTIPTFEYIYNEEIQLLQNTKFKTTIAGAIYWKVKTSSYYNYVNRKTPLILIRYEDIVTIPSHTIQRILDFLDLSWEDGVLKHEKFPHVELDKTGLTIGKTDPKIPIHQTSLNQYSEYLSNEEISEIIKITGDLMVKLDYDVEKYCLTKTGVQSSEFLSMKTLKTTQNNSLERLVKLLTYYNNSIADHKKTITDKDLQITNLSSSLDDHKKTITDKDLQITNLSSSLDDHKKTITDKDLQITNLSSSLDDHKKTITDKDLQITNLSSSLDGIYRSHTWKLLRKIDKITRKETKSDKN